MNKWNASRNLILAMLIVIVALLVSCSAGCSKSGGNNPLTPSDLERQGYLPTLDKADVKGDRYESLVRLLDSKPFPSSPRPKHVIIIIGDGMHAEHEIAESRYLYGTENSLSFHLLPYKTFCTTWDVTTYDRYAWNLGYGPYDPAHFIPAIGYNVYRGGWAPYPWCPYVDDTYFLTPLPKWGGGSAKIPATDSASAGTAISTGYKTDDGNIAWLPGDPPNGALETIHETARKKLGMAIGVVSTVPFSHATPAVFVSHNVSRNNYLEIAHEIIFDVVPDVVIGGGHPNWQSGFISGSDYASLSTHPNYVFVERKAGKNGGEEILKGAQDAIKKGKGLFGLFGGAGGHFEPPVPYNGYPSFTFNEENPQLNEASIAALNVLSKNKKGFILMIEQGDIDWANHSNDFAWMIGATYDLHKCVEDVIKWVEKPGDKINWTNTLLIVTSDHGNSYMRNVKKLGRGQLPLQVPSGGTFVYPNGEITYGCRDHTNELVSLYAMGMGAYLFTQYEGKWYLGTRLIDNTNIYNVISDYLKLS